MGLYSVRSAGDIVVVAMEGGSREEEEEGFY